MTGRRFWLGALAALLTIATFAPTIPAATFPERPITLIVPWEVGGSTDQTARALAKAAEAHLGQTIVVLNKPDVSTALGMAELAAAKPDGYTIGTLSSTTYLIPLRGRVAVLADSKHKTFKGPDRGRQGEPRPHQVWNGSRPR
jgi:tripartite-type tricarboxylate transporter receptor subunit TctC